MATMDFVVSPEGFWAEYQNADAALLTANYWGFTWVASVNCPLYPTRIRSNVETDICQRFRNVGNGAVVSSIYSNTRWRTTYYALASEWGRINCCQFHDFMTKIEASGVFTRPQPRVLVDTYVPASGMAFEQFLEMVERHEFPGVLVFYQTRS